MTNLTYYGKVSDTGDIHIFGSTKFRKEVGTTMAGRNIELTVKVKRKRRSTEQNNYYWGCVLPLVAQGLYEAGWREFTEANQDRVDFAHEVCKEMFLDNGIEIPNQHGEMVKFCKSTTRCTTTEYMEYLDRIGQWAAEFLQVTIPAPNEQGELKF